MASRPSSPRWVIVLLAFVLLTPAGALAAPPSDGGGGQSVGRNPAERVSDGAPTTADDRYYVEFALPAPQAVAAVGAAGGRVVHRFDDYGVIAAQLPAPALRALQRNPNVRSIEADPRRYPAATGDTVVNGETIPYGITMVQATDPVFSAPAPGTRTVCVIDSGYAIEHDDLQDGNVTGADTSAGAWDVDKFGHGSHVAGTIAALGGNSTGVRGVIANGALKLHIVKVFGDNGGWAYSSDLASAARDCKTAGANVINMSLVGGYNWYEERAFNDLYNQGILIVAAAGNNGTTSLSYPASYNSVVSVAAIDANKQVAGFSQKNSQVELAAPGVDVLSTIAYKDTTALTVNGVTYAGLHIENAARTSGVTGTLVDGGYCAAGNGAWSGKVVLCQRGSGDGSVISFATKVGNVETSGGVAAVISNNTPDGDYFFTLAPSSSMIPAIGLSQADGQTALAQAGKSSTVIDGLAYPVSHYEAWNGTSMATPHVAGVAALVWSHNPAWTNVQVRTALQQTAQDLGAAGRDTAYGYGLVQAKAALDNLKGTSGGSSGGGKGRKIR